MSAPCQDKCVGQVIGASLSINGMPCFMHRDKNDANTTEPSRFPMGRVKKEVEGFTPGLGYLRRTDVIMVSDSDEPPGEGNIDKVIEMKFGSDQRDEKQDKAYTDVAGGIKTAAGPVMVTLCLIAALRPRCSSISATASNSFASAKAHLG
ncbi:hypothetical protein FKG94_25095 [Exilibacterium tricleocarpae]|uniref:VRR-NUC domain-containing protein n=1 Tax=Exilibacterium tricleocarpae TaxID=2591008 RepID=A0A545SSB4_9GAMM|nr:hypothetical protein [Exilibacterium tricleocarpae]TQV67806.1 hypothetical protein FKG94_25095 [Exilibacterium tricleocarpae]